MKILFLSKHRSYGVSYGLKNSISFIADFLNKHNLVANHAEVIDGNSIDREVTQFDPQVVIIEALWATPEKIKELLSLQRHKKRNWIIRIHSDVGFLATEGVAFNWIKDYQNLNFKNLYVAVNNFEFGKNLNSFLKKKVLWLPNIYPDNKLVFHNKKIKNSTVDIGCFGALRSLKNQAFQAMCAIKFAEKYDLKLRFHINDTPLEKEYNPIFKNLKYIFEGTKHELVIHPWMHHNEFVNVIRKMDLGMQISYTESFNIVTADFISQGVPIIVSESINWVPWYLRTSTTNYSKVIEKIKLGLMIRNTKLIQKYTKYKLNKYNKKSKIQWLKAFHSY